MIQQSGMCLQSVLISAGGFASSGLLFDKEWVLTHGTLLTNCSSLRSNTVPSTLTLPVLKFPRIEVIVSEKVHTTGYVAGMWRCPLVSGALEKLLGEWVFGNGNSDNDIQLAKNLLPLFILIRLDTFPRLSVNTKTTPTAEEAGRLALSRLSKYVTSLPPLARGQDMLLKSTPFGSKFFLDSWSSGIVSSIGGPQGCLLLSDVRSAPGCEGGPIFRQGFGDGLVGLVLSSLCWWRGEWVGFTIGAALSPVLWQLEAGYCSPKPPLATSHRNQLVAVDSGVALVRCGGSWGSGVVLDIEDGLILTCSHVLKQASSSPVTVYNRDRVLQGKVIYRTKDGLAFDVGLLTVGSASKLESIPLAKTPAIKGEPVVMAGFPLLSHAPAVPVIARGHVSHVAESMLQTTCCVQSGASGGAILRPTGELLALIVCNARDTNSTAIYPHVNLCLQISAIAAVLQRYLQTKDTAVLWELESKDAAVQRLWALQIAPTSKL